MSGEGRYSRHGYNTEVQPVPGIPEEGELPHTEAPGQNLDQGLEGVDPSESVPAKDQTHITTVRYGRWRIGCSCKGQIHTKTLTHTYTLTHTHRSTFPGYIHTQRDITFLKKHKYTHTLFHTDTSTDICRQFGSLESGTSVSIQVLS